VIASVQRRQPVAALADALLAEAAGDSEDGQEDRRLLEEMATAYGLPPTPTLAQVARLKAQIAEALSDIDKFRAGWAAALATASEANLEAFLTAKPTWRARLEPAGGASKAAPPPWEVVEELGKEAASFTEGREPRRRQRLQTLRARTREAEQLKLDLEVRMAALLRIETLLYRLAGETYLRARPQDPLVDWYVGLRSCEDLTLSLPAAPSPPARGPGALPPLPDQLANVRSLAPAWLGVDAAPLPAARRGPLAAGAVEIVGVSGGSPGAAAGLAAGDIVLGPPGAAFSERNELGPWTALLPLRRPQALEVLRGQERVRVSLAPVEAPPAELTPPSRREPLPISLGWTPFRGQPPANLNHERALLFFWATWCVPCKQAVPELMAYAAKTRTPVVAITAEPAATLNAFFARWSEPFPDIVVSDTLGRAQLEFAVRGTPTFVLISGGQVKSYAVGYSPSEGLRLEGWSARSPEE
jgi:thiol-disulfide isomerase/thioredoxin